MYLSMSLLFTVLLFRTRLLCTPYSSIYCIEAEFYYSEKLLILMVVG